MAATIQVEHESVEYLGGTAESQIPRSQFLSRISPKERAKLSPDVIQRLEATSQPPTDLSPPLGSVAFDEESQFQYWDNLQRGFFSLYNDHNRGLNDWQWDSEGNGNPGIIRDIRNQRRPEPGGAFQNPSFGFNVFGGGQAVAPVGGTGRSGNQVAQPTRQVQDLFRRPASGRESSAIVEQRDGPEGLGVTVHGGVNRGNQPLVNGQIHQILTRHPLQDLVDGQFQPLGPKIDDLFQQAKTRQPFDLPWDCEIPTPEKIAEELLEDYKDYPPRDHNQILIDLIDAYAKELGLSDAEREALRILMEAALRDPNAITEAMLAKMPPELRALVIAARDGTLKEDLPYLILDAMQRAGVGIPPEFMNLIWMVKNGRLPNLHDLVAHLPPEMQQALAAINDPTGYLKSQLSPDWQDYVRCLELARDRNNKAGIRCIANSTLPPEALELLKILENPRMLLRRLPPELLALVAIIRDPERIIYEMVGLLPPHFHQLALDIIRNIDDPEKIAKLVLGFILGTYHVSLYLPVWQPLDLLGPYQDILDRLRDHAARNHPNRIADRILKCLEIKATEIIVTEIRDLKKTLPLVQYAPGAFRKALKNEIALKPPDILETRTANPPPSPQKLADESLKVLPESLPIHGAPYPGGTGSPVAIAASQYDSAERSLVASGLQPPDVNLPGIEKHAAYAVINRPLKGWAATPQTDQPKSSDGLSPSTGNQVAVTDRFHLRQVDAKVETPQWHFTLVEDARDTYEMDTALDSWALQASSRRAAPVLEEERQEIQKNSQKCKDSLCDMQHLLLVQNHLARLEAETARLEMARLNLETVRRLRRSPIYLP